jgi:L-asparagine transporter-like permease
VKNIGCFAAVDILSIPSPLFIYLSVVADGDLLSLGVIVALLLLWIYIFLAFQVYYSLLRVAHTQYKRHSHQQQIILLEGRRRNIVKILCLLQLLLLLLIMAFNEDSSASGHDEPWIQWCVRLCFADCTVCIFKIGMDTESSF